MIHFDLYNYAKISIFWKKCCAPERKRAILPLLSQNGRPSTTGHFLQSPREVSPYSKLLNFGEIDQNFKERGLPSLIPRENNKDNNDKRVLLSLCLPITTTGMAKCNDVNNLPTRFRFITSCQLAMLQGPKSRPKTPSKRQNAREPTRASSECGQWFTSGKTWQLFSSSVDVHLCCRRNTFFWKKGEKTDPLPLADLYSIRTLGICDS